MSKKSIGFAGIGDPALIKRIGQNIQLARKNRKYSRAKLSSLAGIGESTLTRLENGDDGVSLGVLLAVLAVMRLDNIKSCRIAEKEDDPSHIELLQAKSRKEIDDLMRFDDE